ncbi:MAG: asparagine synthase [Planctomycetes bacterium]|nr:asparagine synthase [Planctomycetota bacterium]
MPVVELVQAVLGDPAEFGACLRVPAPVWPAVPVPPSLHGALLEAVRSSGADAVSLSGGLDSSLLLALACEAGLAVQAFAMVVDEPDEETARAREVARTCGVKLHEIRVSSGELVAALPLAVRAAGTLTYSTRVAAKFRFWQRCAEAGARCVLSGVGADEVFLGEPAKLLAPAGDAPPFIARRLPECVLGASWLGRQANASPTLKAADPAARLREAQRLLLSLELPFSTLPVECGTAAAAGLRVTLPFLAAPVRAWADAQPAGVLADGELGKLPLRALARTRLPQSVCSAPKVPVLRGASNHGAVAAELSTMLGDWPAQVLGTAPAAHVAAALQALQQGTADQPALLERCLLKLCSVVVGREHPWRA